MNGQFGRIFALAVKELLVVLLDKRVRLMIVAAPVMQLVLFGLATTLEVKNIDLGIVNRDSGMASERLLQALGGSPNVRRLVRYADTDALTRAIENRKVIAGMVIPQDLSADVAAGRTGEIGVLLDGRRINSAQIVAGYLAEIAGAAGAELRPASRITGPQVVAVNWYNPNLDYLWFTMPALIAQIVTVMVFTISLLAVSRERELGSFDELMVLPLDNITILVGKTIPAFLVGLFNATVFVILIPLLYGVPLLGSLPLLLLAVLAYALAVTGIGLSISCLAENQQQAFLGGFLVMVPLILLSGYASPVDNMPGYLQVVAEINPVTHMMIICHGIFLKDIPASMVLAHIWPMLLVAGVTLTLAALLFRSRSR